uniref:Transmembrane protein with EGF-like and two follistatin-like domains 1a n=1 Tax=Esox lucius TaxID=8010 RepID=A0A6Q2Z2Q1_ESOLU
VTESDMTLPHNQQYIPIIFMFMFGCCYSEALFAFANQFTGISQLAVSHSDTANLPARSRKPYFSIIQTHSHFLLLLLLLQCHKNYIPVCGSNGDTYQNECIRRQAACKQQRQISRVSDGPCSADTGSGSGDGEYEGSGSDLGKKFTKCGTCKYGAECDEDSEDVWCICNIDCSGHNENPVCATDGNSYNNPCLVREASCMKQEQIDVKHLGRCPADKERIGKKEDGSSYKPEITDTADQGDGFYAGMSIPCAETYAGFCVHGKCEIKYNMATCRCDSGYKGAQCEEPQDFNILYVVPSGQKLHYVLIAAIIGAVQIAIIVAVVMCITRKCPKNNRGRRQKQNLGHFASDTNSRMV